MVFFFSEDRRFVLKTVTKSELNSLLKILFDYCRYMVYDGNKVGEGLPGHARLLKSLWRVLSSEHVSLTLLRLTSRENLQPEAVTLRCDEQRLSGVWSLCLCAMC